MLHENLKKKAWQATRILHFQGTELKFIDRNGLQTALKLLQNVSISKFG
jgi:hypothetical protein